MSMDEAGVEHAALSFHENKLYCPRPGGEKDEERELWEGSRETVLERSRVFRGGSGLAERMVRRLEVLGREMGERCGRAPRDRHEERSHVSHL